jgi:hypothetical protein
VRWCVLRPLPEPGSAHDDVDLLIASHDATRAKQALHQAGFVSVPAWGRGPHSFMLAYDQASDRWVNLDIVTSLAFGTLHELSSGVEEGCLSRRQTIGGIAALASDDAFWTLVLHCLLDKGRFSPEHRRWLHDLADGARSDGELGLLVDDLAPEGWSASRVVETVRAGDYAALMSLAPALATTWRSRQRLPVRWRVFRSRSMRALTRAFLLRRRGLSIALIASTDAGKSILSAGLQEALPFPVRAVHVGVHPEGPSMTERGRPSVLALAPRLGGVWRRYLVAQIHLTRGRVVVFDDYPCDTPLPWSPRLTGGRARWRVLAHVCPQPDVVVHLDVASEVIRPKGEGDVGDREPARTHYRSRRKVAPRTVVVDASRNPDEVRREVTALLWQRLAQRLGRSSTRYQQSDNR